MIPLKSDAELKKISKSCQIVADVLLELVPLVKPGVTTKELDQAAEKWIHAHGAKSAFKGYRGYPATLCTSINDEVVHGIPSMKKLLAGDIVSIDCGVLYEGFYGDSALTLPVGEIDEESKHLLEVTQRALGAGIQMARVGNTINDVSRAVQECVESAHFSVVRNFVGHGIGRELHEEPQIPNYVVSGESPRIQEGMVLAIEPMVNAGSPDVVVAEDGWTAFTKDHRRSAHFEHTVAVTRGGTLILTQREER